MSKAVAIVRVSSRKQDGGASHAVQEQEIRRYAENAELVIKKVFRITESAKDSEARKQYSSSITWALSHNVKHILFYMYDRECRNLTDNEKNEKLVRAGLIQIHYVRDGKVVHEGSPDSDFFMRDIQAVTNKQFIRNLRAKIIDAMTAKAEGGWFPMGRPPLGYVSKRQRDEHGRELKRGTIIAVSHDVKTVQRVMREYELRGLHGKSLSEIREQVIREGLACAKGYHLSGLEARLKSEFYRGWFTFRGKRYRGRHELFIPESLSRAVDESFEKRVTAKAGRGIFAGWMTCWDCGCAVVFDPKTKFYSRKGEHRTYPYYRCSNGRRVHPSLSGMNVSEGSLWEQFGQAVDDVTVSRRVAADIARAFRDHTQHVARNHKSRVEQLRLQLVESERKQDLLYTDFKAGVLPREMFDRLLTQERRVFLEIHGNLERAEVPNKSDSELIDSANGIIELATRAKSLWVRADPQTRKEVLDLILSNQWLDRTTVRYQLRNTFQALSGLKQVPVKCPQLEQFRTALLSVA